MRRRHISVLGGVATAALLATAAQFPAAAVPAPAGDDVPGTTADTTRVTEKDNRPDRLASLRTEQKQKALARVLTGRSEVRTRGGSQSVRLPSGQWVEYETEQKDQLLSFLVEFGAEKDPRFPTAPAGPARGQIPAPDRSTDNSTYWTPNFDRKHYLDMFFNGMEAQGGESFQDIYKELSSGRYEVNGDVSNWVRLDKNEASYGQTESQADMTAFINDTAEAWYDQQVAEGRTPDEIKSYLQTFDEWDRYDWDRDGNFDEADGYIDHFQAIHAGEGEEAGAPEWAIWSHRWAVAQNRQHADGAGPAAYRQVGGIEIGDTGFWIRDYTTEPENGGLGVFAHEYGHDLGLPDLYDTAGGENGTAFWTLMSSGSWLSHGDGAIGTTPNHMGPWEKLMLGWLDVEQARAGSRSVHDLGPSHHATTDAQAVVVNLPKHRAKDQLGAAAEGTDYFYSGRGDNRTATVTSPRFTVPSGADLTAKVNYAIEEDWDYAYAEVSEDGTTWTPLATNLSRATDPNQQNDGHGITGTSDGRWVDLVADLAAYEGKSVQLRFRSFNDPYTNELGIKVDAVSVGSALSEGAENGASGWTMDNFVIAENGEIDKGLFDHFYIAEYRSFGGYDRTLSEGPYNFGWAGTAPNRVEHFPYQDGMLLWYWNTEWTDNNVSTHPGGGEALPVDAHGKALTWSDGTVARNRIQSYDATFGLGNVDRLSLHREVVGDDESVTMTTLRAGSEPVDKFDDSKPSRYYDPANPGGSVKVPNTGTTIRVVRQDGGTMRIQVN